MHKVYARQLRREIQCSNDQQISPGCATASTNTFFDYIASKGMTYEAIDLYVPSVIIRNNYTSSVYVNILAEFRLFSLASAVCGDR